MALFKIFNNIDSQNTLPNTFTKGYMYFDAVTGVFYIDTAGEGGSTGTRIAVNAKKAWEDENADRISTTYLKIADFGDLLSDLQTSRKIDGLVFDYARDISRYGVCDTAGSTAAKTVTISNIPSLTTGLIIYVKFTYANSASNPTLNLNNLGAINICQYGTTNVTETEESTGWQAGQIVPLIYDGTAWQFVKGYSTNNKYTLTEIWCDTPGSTAAKVSSNAMHYALRAGNYFQIVMRYSNTAPSALTLSINNTSAIPIYINGTASSATNYTLPAGTYMVYYDGTNYYFRTDGVLPGKIEEAAKVTHSLSFGNGTYVFDGSADVVVPSYDGTYTAS